MTIKELQIAEIESFKKDFDELVKKHEDSLKTLKMGISILGGIHYIHYKKDTYAICNDTAFNVEEISEWHD